MVLTFSYLLTFSDIVSRKKSHLYRLCEKYSWSRSADILGQINQNQPLHAHNHTQKEFTYLHRMQCKASSFAVPTTSMAKHLCVFPEEYSPWIRTKNENTPILTRWESEQNTVEVYSVVYWRQGGWHRE